MAELVLHKNPLSPRDVERAELAPGATAIDWLQEHYAEGCDGMLRFYVNGRELELDDLDYPLEADDHVDLIVYPAFEPISWTTLAIIVVLTAASFALQMIFLKKPQMPDFAKSDNAKQSPVYSVSSQQNVARIGEPVPVIYGEVLTTPDVCSQPYRWFNSGGPYDFFDMLLCLGQGEMEVVEILLGDTRLQDLDPNIMLVDIITPDRHQGRIGGFVSTINSPPFVENMITCIEVSDQQFENPNDTAGWFRVGKNGQRGRLLHIDVEFPRGLWQQMDAGDWTSTGVDGRFRYEEVDIDGNPIAGTYVEVGFGPSTVNGTNPCRYSYTFDTGRSAMWRCAMNRQTQREPNGGEQNLWIWAGLRMTVDSSDGQAAYGNATLLAVRLWGNKLSTSVQNKVRVRVRRKLSPLGYSPPVPPQFTANPVDAFIDILTNQVYGARRPLSEVDTAYLFHLWHYYWTPSYQYSFNAVYTGKTTVWEALDDVCSVVAAAPLPRDGFMTIAQDGIKPVRTMLFSEQNIVKDSFKLGFSFDETGAPDGIEIEFRDPTTFAPAYARHPAVSANPDKVQLFGCTDATHAMEVARLMWNRRQFNRRAVNFETELEGLVPQLADRVAVQHTLPRWGQSGFVAAVGTDRLTITLDRKLKWNEVTGPYYMLFRSPIGGASNMVQATRGPSDDIAMLVTDPWAGTNENWQLSDQEGERTHFVWGDATRTVKDFVLTNIQPKGGTQVGVEGVYYAPSVYTDTLKFLALPVP